MGQPLQVHKNFFLSDHGFWSVAFSPDGQRIVSSSHDNTVRLWDINNHSIGQPFRGHEDRVTSVAFSLDGQMIVSGSRDNTVRLWDTKGNPIIGQPFQGYQKRYYVDPIAFSPDGQMIVTSGAFSPDGQWKRIGSGRWDDTVRLWDTKGNPIGQPFRGHESNVSSVAFSPDGQMIASGSWDDTVRLWDLQGRPIGQPLRGHEDFVTSVAFSPDGQMIVSGSRDNTVRLWRVGWGACLQVCCDRLRYHPVFKNPQTDVEKQACETCQKYVWSQEESKE
jgi:WD40 repeat protein